MTAPETRYAKTADGVHIAYEVVGDGPVDIVFVMGWTSHIELMWEEPSLARFLTRLASFSRLILFDKRGMGLSDRVPDDRLPSLEVRMDDARAVMDAVGSERAVVFGVSEGGPMATLFAATYPERTIALVLFGTGACWKPRGRLRMAGVHRRGVRAKRSRRRRHLGNPGVRGTGDAGLGRADARRRRPTRSVGSRTTCATRRVPEPRSPSLA